MSGIGEYLRKELFWLADAVSGGKVKHHVKEIRESIEQKDRHKHDSLLNKKLQDILNHTTTTVPYYHGYSGKSITNFPVIDKNTIRQEPALFLSNAYDEKSRIGAVTSGSTGTPFKVFHDFNKKKRNSADTIYYAARAGFTIGDRLLYLKIWSENNKKGSLQQWMQNIQPVDVIDLDDNKIEILIKDLESSNGSIGILGYSSALELLARYIEKHSIKEIKADVKSIITMSESLNEYTKTTLTKAFKTQVVSRYSNIENGILAQQECDGNFRFLINTASYYIEILDMNSDVQAEDGQLGRIVVTDLYNRAMPMIRYDTGDLGAFEAGNRQYLSRIEGRKLDQVYNTKGELISSYIVYKNMWQYTEIVQYQFIQDGPVSYLFKINANGVFRHEQKLINEFKQYLGADADFRVEYVDEIPLLSSGKRKKIMNTYHNQL